MNTRSKDITHHFDLTGLKVGQEFMGCPKCWTRLEPGEFGGVCCGRFLKFYNVTEKDREEGRLEKKPDAP